MYKVSRGSVVSACYPGSTIYA